MPADELVRHSAALGLKSVELIDPKHWPLIKELGMTVAIDLNEQFRPVHTELKKTRATSQCFDYPMIDNLSKPDATPSDVPFIADSAFKHTRDQVALMQKIAKGLCANHFTHFDEMMAEFEDEPLPVSERETGNRIPATRLVAVYMLLANQQVAGLFEKTQLPFMYRNFDPNDRQGDKPATGG
jgi:exoribonuclease R